MLPKKINVGIIGGGYISQVCYIPFLLKNKNCYLKCISDERLSIREYLYKRYDKYKVKVYNNYEDIILHSKLDLIFIIAPRKTNSYIAEQCLMAGKNIFMEKPISYSKYHSKRLVNIADKNKLFFGISYVKRFDPAIRYSYNKFNEYYKTKKLGNFKRALFYNHSFKNLIKPPRHKKPEESRFIRIKEHNFKVDKRIRDYVMIHDWFMNVLSHNINLLSMFFDINKVSLKKAFISNNKINIDAYFDKADIKFSAIKTKKIEWKEGFTLFFERGKIDVSIVEPFDTKRNSSIKIHINNKLSKSKKIKFIWPFENQIANIFHDIKNLKSSTNNYMTVHDELKFIYKVYNKFKNK